VPTDLHGAISMVDKNRIYFGYGSSAGGMLQIIDREKLLNGPKEPTPANLLYPQISRLDIYPLVGATRSIRCWACRSMSSPATALRPATSSDRQRGYPQRVQAAGA